MLAYLGLAVALDRDGQTRAAREMMQRALALDSTTSVLAVAALPNSDLFFVPLGDVYYYVGLARSVAGRREEATDAFREFLAHQPGEPLGEPGRGAPDRAWSEAAPTQPAPIAVSSAAPGTAGERAPRDGHRDRVSTGGSVAPLIDAAWREQAAILDDCLSATPELATGARPLRLAVELAIDVAAGSPPSR